MAEKNGRLLKVSMGILSLVVVVLIAVFGYGINRVDKNSDRISDIREKYVTEEAFNKRMDKIEDMLRRLEDRP